jgi:predicted hydrocarbon binding protein
MKAKYAKCLMDNFERQFPEDVRVKVMEDCGRGCVGSSIVERALQVKRKANDLAELVEGLNKLHIGGGKMKLEGNKIRAQYARCYCGVVSKTKEKFTSTWCNCSRGWFLGLFEKIFEKPVKVEMTETIIQGAKTCKFIITI